MRGLPWRDTSALTIAAEALISKPPGLVRRAAPRSGSADFRLDRRRSSPSVRFYDVARFAARGSAWNASHPRS
jgi:hypothetical protein